MASSPPSISTSRIFAVPQLDEDSLLSGSHSADARRASQLQQQTGPGRFGVTGSNSIGTANGNGNGNTSHSRSPVKSTGSASGFTLVADGIPGFGAVAPNEGSSLSSPNKADATEAAYLHQQQAAAVASAAAALEQEYYLAQVLMQQSPRPVLLAVLQSLMEDYPTTLIAPVKARLEHFFNTNAALKSSMMVMPGGTLSNTPSPIAALNRGGGGASGRRTSAASFVPNTNAAPWTPSSQQGGGAVVSSAATPYTHTHSPAHSRGATSTKSKGKGAKEEQEMCSIHHSMRAMKHLQLNQATGKYECIHGFHCLVDEPLPAKKESSAAATTTNATISSDRKMAGLTANASSTLTSAENTASSSVGYTVLGGEGIGSGPTTTANENSVLEESDGCIGGRGRSGAAGRGGPNGAVRFVDPATAGGYSGGLQSSVPSSVLHPRGSGSSGRGEGCSPADDELLAYTLKLLQSVRDIEEEEE